MSNYGSRDVLPINRPNKVTNAVSLISFSIFIIIYIGTTIYAYIKGDLSKIKVHPQQETDLDYLKKLIDEFGKSKWLLLGSLGISTVITLIGLFIVRTISRILIIIGLILYLCVFGALIWQVIDLIIHFNGPKVFNAILNLFITGCFIYVKIYAIMRAGTVLISGVAKEACRAVFAFPFAILVPIIFTLLIGLVLINTGVVTLSLMTISMHKQMPFYLGFCHFFNIYAGIWLCLALACFVHMLLFKTYGTWFYTLDKSEVPIDTLLSNFFVILRYQLGTLAYATSIWVIFVIIWTMIKNLRTIARDTRHNIVVMVVSWLYVFGKLFDSSVGVSAIYGASFKKTADRVCKLYLRHPLRLIGIMQAYECCAITLAMLTFMTVVPTIGALLLKKNMTDVEFQVASTVVVFGWLVTLVPVLLVLLAAVTTITYCMFEDFERCQENRNSTSFTKAKLRDLITFE